MGFYGNISNMARAQFQFDKVYSSRKQMDESAGIDGVFAGRFVLVNYEDYSPVTKESSGYNIDNMDTYVQAFKLTKTIYDENNNPIRQEVMLGPSPNTEEFLRFKHIQGNGEVEDDNALEEGQVVIVPADGVHNLDNLNATKAEWWQVVGQESESHNALFVPGADLYSLHYNEDVAVYGTSRGYDSTVWQKTYQNGVDRYVMIAELNTITPVFDIAADAPKMIPLTPHFGTDSTNIYYKLHWSPQWGLRVKAASPNLTGPVLNEDGTPKIDTETKMSSDLTQYQSDEFIRWQNTSYNIDTGESQDYLFTHKGLDKGQWTNSDNVTAKMMDTPAAIYYNKAGFDPKETSYGYEEVSFNEQGDGYSPYAFYIKENGKYKIATNLAYDARKAPYYKKIEDHIKLQPSGFSGKQYSLHDGTGNTTVQEDVQELSIMLPAIGNTIAAVWDLVYGGENVNDGPVRNTDIGWEVARANLDRRGLRLITDYDFNGHYLYQTKNIDTIAGAINSVHDLMGMIITSAYHNDLVTNLDALDINRIYYDKDYHTFNRKRKTYDYTQVDEDIYQYEQVNTVEDWNEWAPGVYFVKENDEYIPDTGNFDSRKAYYVRKFKQTVPNPENPEEEIPVEYEAKDPSTMEIFDGTVYAYRDYLGADSRDYTATILSGIREEYTPIDLDSEEWESGVYYIYDSETEQYILDESEEYIASTEENPHVYYDRETDPEKIYEPDKFWIKTETGYDLDKSEHVREGVDYYRVVYNNNPLMADYVRDSQYNKKKTYYKWDSIDISSPIELSGAYKANTYYIKDNQGNYVLDQSETPNSDKHYYELKRSNILTVRQAINSQLNNIGVYVPGTYLYEYADGKFKIDNSYTKQGTTYYLVSTETEIDQRATNVYVKRIEYEMIPVTEDKYINGIYWIKENNEFILDTSGIFNPNQDSNNGGRPYYIKQEYLDKISEEYYIIDDSDANKVALIQFHEDEFFIEDNYGNFMVINTIQDMIRHGDDLDHVYVLRNSTDRRSGESNAGTYILNDVDYDNPNVSALIKQTTFYEPGKYHYETTDSEGYTDYILDFYPQKTEGRRYFHITAVGNSVEKDFFEGYEYYHYNEQTHEYELITDSSQLPTGSIYQKVGYYVLNDDAHIYSKGMPWSFDIGYIPASVTLATRKEHWGLEPFEDFARNINTMHGMLLKTKAMLDYENEDSRDIRTVQGALNLLGDKIAHFGSWSPDQLILVDKFGRLNGAKIVDSDWLSVQTGYDPEDGKPTIKFINEQNAKYTWGEEGSEQEITFRDIAQVFSGENKELAGNIEYQYADEYSYEEEGEDPYAEQRPVFWAKYDAYLSTFEEWTNYPNFSEEEEGWHAYKVTFTEPPIEGAELVFDCFDTYHTFEEELFDEWSSNYSTILNTGINNITDPTVYNEENAYVLVRENDLFNLFLLYMKDVILASLNMSTNDIYDEFYVKGRNWQPDPKIVDVPAESITYEKVVEKVNTVDDLHEKTDTLSTTAVSLQNQIDYTYQNFLFLLKALNMDIKTVELSHSSGGSNGHVGFGAQKKTYNYTDSQNIPWIVYTIIGDKNLSSNVPGLLAEGTLNYDDNSLTKTVAEWPIGEDGWWSSMENGSVLTFTATLNISTSTGGHTTIPISLTFAKDTNKTSFSLGSGNVRCGNHTISYTISINQNSGTVISSVHGAPRNYQTRDGGIPVSNGEYTNISWSNIHFSYTAQSDTVYFTANTTQNVKIIDINYPTDSPIIWTTKSDKTWSNSNAIPESSQTYTITYVLTTN